jgi:hypothetical protein
MEIAKELQIPKTVVGEDMLYLRNRAKENIKEYVTEYLPEQYQICLRALDTILKHSFEILQTSDDNREKLQAMDLYKNTHLEKVSLLSDATTIDSALNYIKSRQQGQGQRKEKEQQEDSDGDSNDYGDNHLTPATTTTSVCGDTAAGKQTVF